MILTSPARGVDDGAPRGRIDWQEGAVAGLDDFGEAVEHAVPVDDDLGARPKTRPAALAGIVDGRRESRRVLGLGVAGRRSLHRSE